MSAEPSKSSSEPERKPLKPGKGYGIAALLCGAESCCAISVGLLMVWLQTDVPTFRLLIIAIAFPVLVLMLLSPFCVIAGIILGVLARNTEGRLYSYTGLALSVLCGLLLSFAMFG